MKLQHFEEINLQIRKAFEELKKKYWLQNERELQILNEGLKLCL